MGGMDQGDINHTLNISVLFRVGLRPLHCDEDGYAYKSSLGIHAEEDIHLQAKRG